eukprot:6189493-Pleurochrysis_carterae.AAC.1
MDVHGPRIQDERCLSAGGDGGVAVKAEGGGQGRDLREDGAFQKREYANIQLAHTHTRRLKK